MVKGNRLQHYAGQYRVPHRKAALHAIGGLDNRRTQSRPLIKADAINLERERRHHHLSARSGLTGAEKGVEAREQYLPRSEEHTSELQSLMRISYAVFCLKTKKNKLNKTRHKTLVTTPTQ